MFSSLLSLSVPPFSFAFSCAFRMVGQFEPHLIGVGRDALRRDKGTPNFFGPKTDHFFLLWKPFSFSTAVTLKIRSNVPKSNQFFMSFLYIHENLVIIGMKIW